MTQPPHLLESNHHIVNLSWHPAEWNWLSHARPEFFWHHFTSHLPKPRHWVPKQAAVARFKAALGATLACRRLHASLLVTHGPIPALYGGPLRRLFCPKVPHLIFGLNFTQLPVGLKKLLFGVALRQADRYTVFSTMERDLYARYFDLQIAKIDVIHWGAKPLPLEPTQSPGPLPVDYVCAIGSQARDYATLVDAMRTLPNIELVIVAHASNLAGLSLPPNVKVLTSIPLAQVSAVIAGSRFMVLPLKRSDVPCGHVTIVSAFHQGKAVVITDSSGVHDYVQDGVNGRLVRPGNASDLAKQIQSLWSDASATQLMGDRGKELAQSHCSEAAVISYFEACLRDMHP